MVWSMQCLKWMILQRVDFCRGFSLDDMISSDGAAEAVFFYDLCVKVTVHRTIGKERQARRRQPKQEGNSHNERSAGLRQTKERRGRIHKWSASRCLQANRVERTSGGEERYTVPRPHFPQGFAP